MDPLSRSTISVQNDFGFPQDPPGSSLLRPRYNSLDLLSITEPFKPVGRKNCGVRTLSVLARSGQTRIDADKVHFSLAFTTHWLLVFCPLGCCGRCQLARLRGIWWAMDLLSERAREVGSQQSCCSNLSPASASCLIPCCAAAALVHASSGTALVWYWQIWHLAEPVPEGVHAWDMPTFLPFPLDNILQSMRTYVQSLSLFANTFATNHIALVRLDPTRSRTIRCWVPSRWYGLWPFQLWGSLFAIQRQ